MLSDVRAFSGFSVHDIAEAQRFYGEVLGLTVENAEMGLLRVKIAGGTDVLIYPKPTHEPASFTILNLPVSDVDATVDELVSRGVRFQHYDGMDQDEKGVMRGHGPTIAWFTDPSGNVLSVLDAG